MILMKEMIDFRRNIKSNHSSHLNQSIIIYFYPAILKLLIIDGLILSSAASTSVFIG